MRRRIFCSTSLAAGLAGAAETEIPKRAFGKAGEKPTIIGQAGALCRRAFGKTGEKPAIIGQAGAVCRRAFGKTGEKPTIIGQAGAVCRRAQCFPRPVR